MPLLPQPPRALVLSRSWGPPPHLPGRARVPGGSGRSSGVGLSLDLAPCLRASQLSTRPRGSPPGASEAAHLPGGIGTVPGSGPRGAQAFSTRQLEPEGQLVSGTEGSAAKEGSGSGQGPRKRAVSSSRPSDQARGRHGSRVGAQHWAGTLEGPQGHRQRPPAHSVSLGPI